MNALITYVDPFENLWKALRKHKNWLRKFLLA